MAESYFLLPSNGISCSITTRLRGVPGRGQGRVQSLWRRVGKPLHSNFTNDCFKKTLKSIDLPFRVECVYPCICAWVWCYFGDGLLRRREHAGLRFRRGFVNPSAMGSLADRMRPMGACLFKINVSGPILFLCHRGLCVFIRECLRSAFVRFVTFACRRVTHLHRLHHSPGLF